LLLPLLLLPIASCATHAPPCFPDTTMPSAAHCMHADCAGDLATCQPRGALDFCASRNSPCHDFGVGLQEADSRWLELMGGGGWDLPLGAIATRVHGGKVRRFMHGGCAA
jgi:hypothetical protein